MRVSNKTARVVPNAPTTSPYIKGTQVPNYYLVTNDTDAAVVGFRPLAESVPAIDSVPVSDVETRIRFVPKDQSPEGLKKAACVVECLLGFGLRKYDGETQTHFSLVTTNAPAVLAKVSAALTLL